MEQWKWIGVGAALGVGVLAGFNRLFQKAKPAKPVAPLETLPPELRPQPMGAQALSTARSNLSTRRGSRSEDKVLFMPKAGPGESCAWARLLPLPHQTLTWELVEEWAKQLGFLHSGGGYWVYGGRPLSLEGEPLLLRLAQSLGDGRWPIPPSRPLEVPGLVLFLTTAHPLPEELRWELDDLLMQWASRWSRGLALSVWNEAGQAWFPSARKEVIESPELSKLWQPMAEAGWVQAPRLVATGTSLAKETMPSETQQQSGPGSQP